MAIRTNFAPRSKGKMELVEQLIQERVYRKGVSPKSGVSCSSAFPASACAAETKMVMMQRVAHQLEKGLNPISVK
jgi:hypothetical protein